jgi:hypothetical protein
MTVYASRKKVVNFDNHTSTAILGVSIGSDLHQGENLVAICRWINENYKRCLVDLSDTLHRFNIAHENDLSLPRANQICRGLGSEWIIKNKIILKRNLGIPFRLRRWDENIDTVDFLSIRKEIGQIYQVNPDFQAAVKKDIKRYASRKNLSIEDSDFYSASESYLLEEISAQIYIYSQYRGDFVYPGRQLYSLEFVRSNKRCFNFAEFSDSTYVRLVLHGQQKAAEFNREVA